MKLKRLNPEVHIWPIYLTTEEEKAKPTLDGADWNALVELQIRTLPSSRANMVAVRIAND